jgi:hypothetical protein
MDAVKEALLEQKIDDLAVRFDRAEHRNWEEHRDVRVEIQALRTDLGTEIQAVRTDLGTDMKAVRTELGAEIGELRGDIQHLSRTVALGFASIAASAVGGFAAALLTHAL